MGISRRSFLKISGLTAAGSLAGGLGINYASGSFREPGIPEAKDKAMLIDVSKCIGCTSCVTACKKQNNLPNPYKNSGLTNGENWTTVKFFKGEKGEKPSLIKVKMQCMHCAKPSCVAICSTGAAYKGRDGIVLIDGNVCIGCKNCVAACPFAVPGENEDLGVVEKCTFCKERLADGKPTICSEVCPTGAISFGERDELLNAANKRLEQLKSDGFKNAVLYGSNELGGLKVIYVLPVEPSQAGLPENPEMANGDVLLKWAMGFITTGAVIVGPIRGIFRDDDTFNDDKGVDDGE